MYCAPTYCTADSPYCGDGTYNYKRTKTTSHTSNKKLKIYQQKDKKATVNVHEQVQERWQYLPPCQPLCKGHSVPFTPFAGGRPKQCQLLRRLRGHRQVVRAAEEVQPLTQVVFCQSQWPMWFAVPSLFQVLRELVLREQSALQ